MMSTHVEQHRQGDMLEAGADAGTLLEGGWLLLPALAVIGGAWAFADPAPTGTGISGPVTAVAAALALVIGGWLPLWRALTRTPWAAPLQSWRGWTEVDPMPRWPYLQERTPGAALRRRLGQARAWWRQVGREALARPLRRAMLSIAVSLLLGIALQRTALLLSVVLLALAELAALWHEGEGEVGSLWEGAALVGLPWLLGATLQRGISGEAALAASALTLLVALYARPAWTAVLGPIVGVIYLTGRGQAMAAGWLVLLAIPGLMMLVQEPDRQTYRQAVAPWVLAMLLLVAGAL
jgi:hypothetical protein